MAVNLSMAAHFTEIQSPTVDLECAMGAGGRGLEMTVLVNGAMSEAAHAGHF